MTVVDELRQGRLGVDAILADRYELVCRVARGGMGTVYLARQLGLDRRVAIKVLHPEKRGDAELVSLFKREAVAIKHLTHPNTVRLYDVGETPEGALYLVMEYLEGECLDAVLERRGALPAPLVVHIGMQVLKSLIEAHARGIVHRDIKPSNLMLCRQLGEPDFVKVLDFGIAWHDLRGAPASPDKPGEVMGTPRYMSPEQLMGLEVDPRSDLYSLGLTLYELATARPVFTSNQLDQVMAQRAKRPTIALPPELEGTRLGAVVSRSLADAPAKRFPAAGDMLEALLASPLQVSFVEDSPALFSPWRANTDTPVPPLSALDPTVPRFPGQPVGYLDPSPPGDEVATPGKRDDTWRSIEVEPPLDDARVVDELHPMAALVKARIEARLWRRTALTALVTGLVAAALSVTLALL